MKTLPCKNCIIQPCCTEECDPYLEFFLDHNIIDITCIGDTHRTYMVAETAEIFRSPDEMTGRLLCS